MVVKDIIFNKTKKDDSIKIILNNNDFLIIDSETFYKNKIDINQNIDFDYLQNIKYESDLHSATNKCVSLLSKMLKTEKQIKDYLYQKGYHKNVVESCINKLKEYNLINDEQYVKAYIKKEICQNGIKKIKSSLYEKGITRTLIDEIDKNDFDQTEVVKRIAEKYMKSKEISQKNLIKLQNHLLMKGFDYDDIKTVRNELFLNIT